MLTEPRSRALPDAGGWRVHPDPGRLPRLVDEGPGRNRYDDPYAVYGVRYVAEELTGCLIETMARFRPVPQVETRLRAVTGLGSGGPDFPDPTEGLSDWLAIQRVARIMLEQPAPLVDIHDPNLLAAIAKHPLVQSAIEGSGLGTRRNPAMLDEGVVRLGGRLGRPITQAVSRAIHDWFPHYAGIAYRSRLDDDEWCWALWEETAVTVEEEPLDPNRRHHRQAVHHAASQLEIVLPSHWS